MKRIVHLLCICLLFGLTACNEKPTLESYIDHFIEENPGAEKTGTIVEIDFENAYFGLSYINMPDVGKTLFMSGLIVDEYSAIVSETHGWITPLYFYPDIKEGIWGLSTTPGVLEPFQYMDLESNGKIYYAGVFKGFYNQVEYPEANIQARQWTFHEDQDIDITFWVAELDKDIPFDIENIVYQ